MQFLSVLCVVGLLAFGQPFVLFQSKDKGKADHASSAVKLELLDEAAFENLTKNRKGKALLINFWATWCVPCVEEFPDLVKLDRDFKTKNVDIVAVSIDDKGELESKVIPFLRAQKASMRVFVNNFKKDEALINTLNQQWSGAVPATFIYDSKGNQRAFLLGKQHYENFKSALENVLNAR